MGSLTYIVASFILIVAILYYWIITGNAPDGRKVKDNILIDPLDLASYMVDNVVIDTHNESHIMYAYWLSLNCIS